MPGQAAKLLAFVLVIAACAAPAWADGIERVSVGPRGVQGNDYGLDARISADGRFVAFVAAASNLVPGDTNAEDDVFVRDRTTGATTRVSVGPGGAQGNGGQIFDRPAISADGRFVAFASDATNLVRGDTNGFYDVFLHDRATGVTRRPSVGPAGVESRGGGSIRPALSADGCLVAFDSGATNLVPGDTNRTADVFVRTRCRAR